MTTDYTSGHSSQLPHIIVIGGGFAGLNAITHLDLRLWRVTVIDANNFHSFPPLFYQVASAGLDAASICFPLRRELRKLRSPNVTFNMGKVDSIDTSRKTVHTDLETLHYDRLIIAAGTTNNYFGNDELAQSVYTIKSTDESVRCRNDILRRLEKAAIETSEQKRREMLHFVVVGGGPTGVEIAGALGEMKRYVIPREYPSIRQSDVSITIIEGSSRLLRTMSESSSKRAAEGLGALMVETKLNSILKTYDPDRRCVELVTGETLPASMVIWTAGVTGVRFAFQGVETDAKTGQPTFVSNGNRLLTDRYCRIKGLEDVYAIGDISLVHGDEAWPKGHPQLAQVAIQQGRLVARNLNEYARRGAAAKIREFSYRDKGSMATIGRNRAVVDMGKIHLGGFPAWMAWMGVHLLSLLGMRNKITVLINWIWAYFNYASSLRLIIRPSKLPNDHT